MKDWISFEDYLWSIDNGDKYYYDGKKWKRYEDDEVICKKPPDFWVMTSEYNREELAVECYIAVGKHNIEDYSIIYYVREGKNCPIVRMDEDSSIEDVMSEDWVRDNTEIARLLKSYFRQNIERYYTIHRSDFFKCGWGMYNEIGYQYRSVTYRSKNPRECFENMLNVNKYFKEIDDKKELSANCLDALELLKTDRRLVAIFAYTIHALIWDYKYEYDLWRYEQALKWLDNMDTLFFSMCLYGKDDLKSKAVANAVLDLFRSPENVEKISLQHHISATSIDSRVDRLRFYGSVPIIVTSKTNRILKSSAIVRELYRKRRSGRLFVYPAFISNIPINVDEMINIETSEIAFPDPKTEKNEIRAFHAGLMEIIGCFIFFLRNIASKNKKTAFKNYNLDRVKTELEQNGYDIQENLPAFLLYVALTDFGIFLNKIGLNDESERLKKIYREGFIYSDKTTVPKAEESNPEQFDEYLLRINEIVQDRKRPQYEWVKESNEPKGEHERCYYLKADKWYEDFSARVQRKKLNPVKKRVIVNYLYDRGLLKTANPQTKGLKRNNQYYLVIKADQFDQLIDELHQQ